MSNLKRMVSSILVLAMIATSGVFALGVFAENEEATPSIVELEEKDILIAEKLVTFGLIDAVDEAQLTTYITRAESVDVFASYLGMGDVNVDSATTPFIDVPVDDERIDAYNVLYQSGYISGDENRRFHPDNYLTYNEAVTLVVNVMGYKMFAVRNGGYPEGYLYIANQNDLLGGLRGSGSDPIPYCDLYLLIERSLKADAVAERGYTGSGEASFILREGYTVLEELFGIKELEGVVTGTENTRLVAHDSSGITTNQIEINNVVYDAPGKVFADLLGMYVTAYGKRNEYGEYDIVHLEADTKVNHKYQISAEDLLIPKTTASRIYYRDEDYKERHIDLATSGRSVIYNGKSYSRYADLKDVLPANGYIMGLDNSGDEVVDVLFIYEFENYVVGAADFFSYTFYDKYDSTKSVVLDPHENDIRVYDKDYQQIKPEDIVAGDLLSVMESKNTIGRKLITVYNIKSEVTGTIEEIRDGNKYVIKDQGYELAANAIEYIADGNLPPIDLGKTATFYLDMEGKISHYEASAKASYTYGFVAGKDSQLGIDNKLTLRIYTQNGTWVEADTVDKVNIDGTRYSLSSSAELTTALSKIPVGEVILFGMSDDKINYIDTVALNRGNATKLADEGNLNKIIEGEGFFQRNDFCFSSSDISQQKFVAKSGSCIVFVTPARDQLLSNPEAYAVVDKIQKNQYTSDEINKEYKEKLTDGFVAYNLGEKDINVATCILLRGTAVGAAISELTNIGILTKVTTAVDEDGISRTKLYYAENGKEKECMLATSLSYSAGQPGVTTGAPTTFADIKLQIGDLIQVGIDEEGYANMINVVYRQNPPVGKENDAWILPGTCDMDDTGENDLGGTYGTVVAYDPATQVLQFASGVDGSGNPKTYNIGAGQANISLYRPSLEKAESASTADFVPGDVVIITSKDFKKTAMQIIILK